MALSKTNYKISKFLLVLKEALDFNKPSDNRIDIHKGKLLAHGLDGQDVELCIKKVSDEKVVEVKGITEKSFRKSYYGNISSSTSNTNTKPDGIEDGETVFHLIVDGDRLRKILTEYSVLDSRRIEEIFDPINCLFILAGEIYKPRTNLRKSLVKKLWGERLEANVQKGQMFPKSKFAVEIGLVDSANKFNQEAKETLKQEIKAMNKEFKKKNFPLHIKTRGGVQLIVS